MSRDHKAVHFGILLIASLEDTYIDYIFLQQKSINQAMKSNYELTLSF